MSPVFTLMGRLLKIQKQANVNFPFYSLSLMFTLQWADREEDIPESITDQSLQTEYNVEGFPKQRGGNAEYRNIYKHIRGYSMNIKAIEMKHCVFTFKEFILDWN